MNLGLTLDACVHPGHAQAWGIACRMAVLLRAHTPHVQAADVPTAGAFKCRPLH